MNDRIGSAVLIYPTPLYAALFVLSGFGGSGLGLTVGFLLAVGFGAATALGFLRVQMWIWLGRIAFAILVLVPLAEYPSGAGGWIDIAAGVVIGSPFLWLEYAWRDASSPAARVVALQSAFVVGILSLTTVAASSSVSGSSGGWQFFDAFGQVITGQLEGVAALLTGATPNGVPLDSTFNVTYAALGGLALLGVALTWMHPHTAHDEPLPWSWLRFRTSRAPAPPPAAAELVLRPGQREALATRTLPTSPDSVLPPGFGSLLVTGALLFGFVAFADAAPSYALLALVLGCVAALLAVGFVLARRLDPLGGLEG